MSRFTDYALALTARKGNHPVLWLLFGAGAAAASMHGLVQGETIVAFPRWWTDPRFAQVTLADEPVWFFLAVVAFAAIATLFLSVGIVALRARARQKGRPHPLAKIVN